MMSLLIMEEWSIVYFIFLVFFMFINALTCTSEENPC